MHISSICWHTSISNTFSIVPDFTALHLVSTTGIISGSSPVSQAPFSQMYRYDRVHSASFSSLRLRFSERRSCPQSSAWCQSSGWPSSQNLNTTRGGRRNNYVTTNVNSLPPAFVSALHQFFIVLFFYISLTLGLIVRHFHPPSSSAPHAVVPPDRSSGYVVLE